VGEKPSVLWQHVIRAQFHGSCGGSGERVDGGWRWAWWLLLLETVFAVFLF
jgi:hypothetical protein